VPFIYNIHIHHIVVAAYKARGKLEEQQQTKREGKNERGGMQTKSVRVFFQFFQIMWNNACDVSSAAHYFRVFERSMHTRDIINKYLCMMECIM
jgi:hypothetical protein